MASRQDQLHSHQLMTQRVVSALVQRDSDPDRPPLRGAAGAALAGLLVTAIALGAVAAWGQFAGQATGDWRQPDVLVVEEGSGARYVWRDDALHPVGSYTSARLVLGEPNPRTVTVPPAALHDVPRGAPLGIPGSPDALPPADRLVPGGWTLCSTVAAGDGPASVLVIGAEPAGAVVPPEDGLLVEAAGGQRYLLWQQHRHRVRDEEVTLAALGWAGRQPVPVAAAVVEALPLGPDLARITVPGLGQASVAVPGATVGEVFEVAGRAAAPQYAVALPDGLAPLTAVQVDLLLTDPRTTSAVGQREPRSLSQAEFAAVPRLDAAALAGADLPPTAPRLAQPDGDDPAVCAVVPDEAGVAGLLVDVRLPPLARAVRTAGRTDGGDPLADHVLVASGRGAVVSAAGDLSVVTDLGVRHPVEPDALAPLGYADVAPVALPPGLVSLLPAGPALDPAAARHPVGPG